MIYLLFLFGVALGGNEQTRRAKFCSRWENQAKNLKCNQLYSASFALYCPELYAAACIDDKTEDDDIALNRIVREATCQKPDDPVICPKWDKQSAQEYCSTNAALRMKYCCTLTKEKCRNHDGTSKTKSAEAKQSQPGGMSRLPSAEDNFKACCRANGVPPECMKICTYSPTGTEMCNPLESCETFFLIQNYCGNNNGDNTACCEYAEYPQKCTRFCMAVPWGPFPFIDVGNAWELSWYQECFETLSVPRQCAMDAYPTIGPNWNVGQVPPHGVFPREIKQKVMEQPACTGESVDGSHGQPVHGGGRPRYAPVSG